MKKYLAILFILFSMSLFGQTRKRNILLDVGFSPVAEATTPNGSATEFSFLSLDGDIFYSIGADIDYFIKDNLAIKMGLGYSDYDILGSFLFYRSGVKYYAKRKIPLQLDITGTAIKGDHFGDLPPDPIWLGTQVGYSIQLNERIVFEPSYRVSVSLNSGFGRQLIRELRFNFVIPL